MIPGGRAVWPAAAALCLAAAVFLPPLTVQRRMPSLIAVVDITQSMNVTDESIAGHAVSRLEFVKEALATAVNRLPCGSKLGLGIFTEYRPFILTLPVDTCIHRNELLANVAAIDGRMAWAGASEISKGLYSALRLLKTLANPPALAFITDGHEAPPINPYHRLDLAAEAGAGAGIIIGVGGLQARPIPKIDPDGNPAGVWEADEVMQTDPYSQGRQGNEAHELMADDASGGPVARALRSTPGLEHLSALHEEYLETLAAESGFAYARLAQPDGLAGLIDVASLSSPRAVRMDLRWIPALLALTSLLLQYALPAVRDRRRRGAGRSANVQSTSKLQSRRGTT